MSTNRKHIAVYLHPEVEVALIKYCEQKGFKSKKGIKFSAGVNAALAEAFNIQASSNPRNARLHIQILELQDDVHNLYRTLDKIGGRLAHLAEATDNERV